MDTWQVIEGDCREVMATLEPESVDAIVTDPPYELGFMGKGWDSAGVSFAVETWAAAYRVLKPGGHLLAFGGTRTYHRIAVAIEDAGFEIRDSMLYWGYGTGFPKSLNVTKAAKASGLACSCGGSAVQYSHETVSPQDVPSVRPDVATGESLSIGPESYVLAGVQRQETQPNPNGAALETQSTGDGAMRGMWQPGNAAPEPRQAGANNHVLLPVQWETASAGIDSALGKHEGPQAQGCQARPGQSSMEGRSNVLSQAWQLQADQVRAVSGGIPIDGSQGRLCDGASAHHGENGGILSDAGRGGASRESQSAGQHADESRAMAGQSQPQAVGRWPHCARCGLPILPEGLGTALKPSYEPIVVARKPISERTVAANVLAHGTGALNIDGTRIEASESTRRTNRAEMGYHGGNLADHYETGSDLGRWPANVVLDEAAAALLDAETGELGNNMRHDQCRSSAQGVTWGTRGGQPKSLHGDTGGASRFYYVAKASRRERNAGLEGMSERAAGSLNMRTDSHSHANGMNTKPAANHHPTVKPIALMRWLVRLVTPPGGIVLDPFNGSGSTGIAATLEGFRYLGIEQSPEYAEIARRRIAHWLAHGEDGKPATIGKTNTYGYAKGRKVQVCPACDRRWHSGAKECGKCGGPLEWRDEQAERERLAVVTERGDIQLALDVA